jgi:hypothetical protein
MYVCMYMYVHVYTIEVKGVRFLSWFKISCQNNVNESTSVKYLSSE